jgi:hypothetical protein
MFRQRTAGIEQQVTRSAVTLLYGHAMAWDVPGPGRSQRPRGRRVAAGRRVGAVVAGTRPARRRPVVAVDAGPCS